MDSTNESLESYLLGNFEQMNSDIIGVILGQIDPLSALRLCQTSKKFYELCGKIKALDKKALEFVSREAPLSVPVRTPAENAELIKRGFKTIYTVRFEEAELFIPSQSVRFGIPDDGFEFGMEIVGLPPPKGTRVWIIVDTNWDEGVPIAQVYSHREELIQAWNLESNRYITRLKKFFEDEDDTLSDLLKGIMILQVIIREVELP